MKELFGQRLREQRLKHHLTLEQVAEKADLSANYIGMVERGLKEPGLATIVKILNALNISADELLCDLVPSASHVTDWTPISPICLTSPKKNNPAATLAHQLNFGWCAFLLQFFRL